MAVMVKTNCYQSIAVVFKHQSQRWGHVTGVAVPPHLCSLEYMDTPTGLGWTHLEHWTQSKGRAAAFPLPLSFASASCAAGPSRGHSRVDKPCTDMNRMSHVRANIFVSHKGACRACRGDIIHAQYNVGKAEAVLVVEIQMPNPILLFLSRTNWIINRLSFFFF